MSARARVPLVALAVAIVATPGRAQDRLLSFEHLTVEDGLPSSWVRGVLEDRRGFMWFTTGDGVTRYDGRRFVVYRPGLAGGQEAASHQALNLFEDERGRLWAGLSGTPGGVARYDSEADTFEFVPVAAADESLVVSDLAQREGGRLWLATESGLVSFDPESGVDGRWRHDPEDSRSLSDDRVWRVLSDDTGLWIATARGLDRLGPDGEVQRWAPEGAAAALASAHVTDLHRDGTGALWVTTMGDGLFRLHPETGRSRQYLPRAGDPASLSTVLLTRITGDGNGLLYVGTEDAGLEVLDTRTDRVTHYPASSTDTSSVSSRSVWSVYLADRGILWVGTFNAGVDRARAQGPRFQVIRAGSQGLGAPQVSALLEDSRGDLWVGTDGGGLDRLDRQTGRFTRYRHDPDTPGGLSSNAVLSLHEDDAGNIWIGTWEGGLQRLAPHTGRFTTFQPDPAAPTPVHYEHVRVILEENDGDLLLGTQESGVVEMHRRSGRFTPLASRYPDLVGVLIYTMTADETGDLWIGHSFVEHLDRETGRVMPYRLGADWILDIHVDSRGHVWFGTDTAGLWALEPATGTLHQYGREHGLPSETVQSVTEDEEGNLWLGTSRGLVRFADGVSLPSEPRILVFDVRDGLPGYEFRLGAKLRTRSGEIFLGGQRGLTHFTPAEFRLDRRPPRVVLTGLELMQQRVHPGEPGSPLDKAIGEIERLVLAPEHAVVTFEFAALEHLAPAKSRFRHRLVGFDEDWSPPDTAGSATYTNLPAGSYRFEVVAANGDGVWSDTAAAVEVRRTPRFYETRWFGAGILALALGLATGLHRLRVQRHRRAEAELDRRIHGARAEIRTLSGLLPFCGGCHMVRDDAGYWSEIEVYVSDRTAAAFSHGICPDCLREYRERLHSVSIPARSG
jgi:ligand-binding sensor domain-containing protein